jgi:hypothetical protein
MGVLFEVLLAVAPPLVILVVVFFVLLLRVAIIGVLSKTSPRSVVIFRVRPGFQGDNAVTGLGKDGDWPEAPGLFSSFHGETIISDGTVAEVAPLGSVLQSEANFRALRTIGICVRLQVNPAGGYEQGKTLLVSYLNRRG